ncbi:MAG TPA: hypothetical protein VFN84_03430 [Pseudolabrys sp.]|nr:hypothetical protein [Pseudolabrys sp.]
MRAIYRAVLLTGLAVAAPTLTACSNFDLDKLDVFGLNEKKKLPGERKDLFPGGVPGVTQGIPPEYMRGNQPTPETAQSLAPEQNKEAAAAEQESKPEPEQKPKRAAKPRTASSPPPQASAQPSPWPQQDQQPAQQSTQAPWPAPAQTNTPSPWPSSPQPGTFSR